jgi:tRNA(adenine34) deaminase
MQLALQQAKLAQSLGEVPVGAVLALNHRVVSACHNSPIRAFDPSAHAEILALREAGRLVQNYRFPDTTLYVTLEPCLMCLGALAQARIGRLVIAASDGQKGFLTLNPDIFHQGYLNHRFEIQVGLLAEESSKLLKTFFKARR